MAKLFGGKKKFSTKGKKTMDDYDLMPEHWDHAKVVESDYKENNEKTGHYVWLKWEITRGKFKGRFLFTVLNLDHPKEQAVEIAEKELTTICAAMGLPGVEDTSELHGKEVQVRVGIQKAKKGSSYPDQNRIKNYKAIEEKPAAPVDEEEEDDDEEEAVETTTEKSKPKRGKPAVTFDDDDDD